MAFTTIASSRYEVGKSVKKELIEDLALNDSDLDTRTSALEGGGAASVNVFDEIVTLEQSRVGDIRYSLLTDTQFNDRFGNKWVRIDGSSISGEDLAALYGSTLPNFSGHFPRISSGIHTVGATEANQNKTHSHNQLVPLQSDNTSLGPWVYNQSGSETGVSKSYLQADLSSGISGSKANVTTGDDGGSEARPDSGIMNAFIKVSETNFEYAVITTARSAFNMTQLKVSNLIAGDSGTLTIDLLKGSALGSLTTMLSSNLTLTAASGDYATSSNATFSVNAVAQNDFLVLKVVGTQVGQDNFYVNAYGALS